MSVSELRSKVRAVILGITGLLIAFLFARVVLDLIQADKANPFVEFIKQISDFLAEPFESLASNDTGIENLNVDALISIFMYFIIGLILSEIITAFIYDDLESIVQNFVDAIFKIFEFIFFLRIVFDFFEVNEKAKFISAIYDLTKWSDGLLNINFLDGRLNFSAVVILIIIIVFDILTESFLRSIFNSTEKKVVKTSVMGGGSTVNNVTIAPVPTHSNQMQPMRQNITVNIPAPAPRPVTTIVQPTRTMAIPIPQNGGNTMAISGGQYPASYQRFNNANVVDAKIRTVKKKEGLGSKLKKFFGS